MQIRQFIAPSYAEALDQIKKEWGDEALILSTRKIKNPTGQSFSGRVVEITAAIDHESPLGKKRSSSPKLRNTLDSFEEDDREMFQSLLCSLLSQEQKAKSWGLSSQDLEIYSQLIQAGIDEKLASKVIVRARSLKKVQEAVSNSLSLDEIKNVLQGLLVTDQNRDAKMPHVLALVGSAGVGKSTTISKLAADITLRQGKTAALLSLDSDRSGAFENLNEMKEWIPMPIEKVSGRKEFMKAVVKYENTDVVLVDTPGKDAKEWDYPLELKSFLRSYESSEVHLVLSSTDQENVYHSLIERFSPLLIDKVLFTKVDEGVNFGPMYNFSVRHRVPMSYFTTGQNIMNDLQVASPEKVIRLIFN